ncbi:cytochrome P450 3A19-like isoform X2 [Mya arenaria]|uniref:cytochrome P450 3A19-like isoform X2 n=1 Tax=Mya arenaria TaxID=6604 RepID=UPI0022E1823A|nr:cytochrome P450 3A19-like isoform X2 [Mya arenaria]XP_052819005.1 cytochrome P450 3A19-like isoform X2 [Mya arenaria]
MIAGFDTIASTLSWLVYDLVTHPDIQDRLIAEIDEKLAGEEPNYDKVFGMSYLDMIVSETLRMHPVAPKLIRQGSQPMEICGVRIPEGIEIHIPVTTLHFMPEYWEQPEVYNPERFSPENKAKIEPYAYLPFGQGPRNCIGMRLALLELKMTAAFLLQRFRFRRAPGLKVPMPIETLFVVRPGAPVLVTVETRNRTSQ